MEDKITTLVAIVGIAVAISKEAREWYKATKKEKRKKAFLEQEELKQENLKKKEAIIERINN